MTKYNETEEVDLQPYEGPSDFDSGFDGIPQDDVETNNA